MNKTEFPMEAVGEVVEALLKDDHCLVHVNTLVKELDVPASCKGAPTVTLKLSRAGVGLIAVDPDAIRAELHFDGRPYLCTIPFSAVWGVSSYRGEHTTWDDRAPHPALPLLLKQSAPTMEKPKQIKKAKEQKDRPSFLKRVK